MALLLKEVTMCLKLSLFEWIGWGLLSACGVVALAYVGLYLYVATGFLRELGKGLRTFWGTK